MNDDQWHLDKKVPISLIFALLCQFAAGLWAFADLKKDVELLKADAVVLHQRDDNQAVTFKDSMKVLQDQLMRLDTKLDRLIERSK